MTEQKEKLPVPSRMYDSRYCRKCGERVFAWYAATKEYSTHSGRLYYNVYGRCKNYSFWHRNHFNEVLACRETEEDAREYCGVVNGD